MSTTPQPAQFDPPLPNRVNTVREMSAEEARSATFGMFAFGAIVLVGGGSLWMHGNHGWGGFLALLGLVLGGSAFAKKSLMAACPFCNAKLAGITREAATKGRLIRCNDCFEYSQLAGMRLKPMDPSNVADKPKFLSPVFENGVWPNGCVQCGAPAVRTEELKDRSLNAAQLAVGRLWLTTAKMKNVPYCAEHKDAIDLNVNQSRQLDLKWRSLRMLRRYLAANRGKKSLGSKVLFNVDQP